MAAATLSLILGAGTALGFGAGGTASASASVSTSAAKPRAGGSTLASESFRHATAPEFVGVGDACLTGAPAVSAPLPADDHTLGGCYGGVNAPPADGDPYGYLRLTDATNDKSGAALYDQAIPADHGLDVMFDQWQYGSTTPVHPADGISFFLVNGDVSLTRPGAFGGSLGYAQKLDSDIPSHPFLPGVDEGYLGVGLDLLGNFFGDWEHRGNGCPPGQRSPAGTAFRVPAPGTDMVTVRGPGDGVLGYCFLYATADHLTPTPPWRSTLPGSLQGPLATMPAGISPQAAETLLEPSRRRVHVVLTPVPDPQLSVEIDFNDGRGFQRVIDKPAPTPVPHTYKFGFGGSTGLYTDVHLIRNVVVATDEPLPELNLVKQVRHPLPGALTLGDEVPYEFVVTNSGGTPLTDITVIDPKIGPVSCPRTTLQPGETETCTAVYRVTAEDVARGSVENTAVASGLSNGTEVTSPPSSESVPLVEPPALEVEKSAVTPGPYSVGQTVTFTYTVRNRGGLTIDDIRVDDDHVAGITCETTTLTPFETPGDTTTCTGTYTITAADGEAGEVTNHAVATGTASNGTEVTSPQVYQILLAGPSHLDLTKQVASPGPFHIGDQVTYTYTVTNTHGTELTDVAVDDDHVPGVVCETTTLAPEQSTTCTGIHTITEADVTPCQAIDDGCALTNHAVAGGTPPEGDQIISDQVAATIIVEVRRATGLSLAKQAVTPGPFQVGDTVAYTYTVTNTGDVAVHDLAVTDNVIAAVTCDATTLAPGASTTCHASHVITEADITPCEQAVDGCVLTNLARATALDPGGQEVTANDSTATITVRQRRTTGLTLAKRAVSQGPFRIGDTVAYAYTVTNTGDAAVHDVAVTDNLVTAVTCEVTSLAPGASTTCRGNYTVAESDVRPCARNAEGAKDGERGGRRGGADGGGYGGGYGGGECGEVTNTAHATATDPQGDQVTSDPATATIRVKSGGHDGYGEHGDYGRTKPGKPGKSGKEEKAGEGVKAGVE
ncbi:hypothetical protein ABZ990_03005 [Streptomyces sp. NPDC046203]|uniref:DUF7507 domain-containing protein n=1 Tax=Streptomyces sp. NPDC046203 TaxID=3154602 RepID=UPI00340C7107